MFFFARTRKDARVQNVPWSLGTSTHLQTLGLRQVSTFSNIFVAGGNHQKRCRQRPETWRWITSAQKLADTFHRPAPISKLTRLRRSLTLSESYEDDHIDANSLVRDNLEWLPVRVDAFRGAFFCWAFLHGQDVRAGRQGGAIVSRLVCSQPRDLSFPVLTQDDQWFVDASILSVRGYRKNSMVKS
jgi:hypothetical protein